MRSRSLLRAIGLGIMLIAAASSAFAAEDLWFSVNHNNLPTSGSVIDWAGSTTSYGTATLTRIGTTAPTVETIVGASGTGVVWEKNSTNNGFVVKGVGGDATTGVYSTAFTVDNGISLVAAIKPIIPGSGTNLESILNIFGGRFALAYQGDGIVKLRVRADGTTTPSYDKSSGAIKLTNGAATVLSAVVTAGGQYKVWASGYNNDNPIISGTFTSTEWSTIMTPITPASGNNRYVTVGSTYGLSTTCVMGNIGDVYVYKSALTDSERAALVSNVQTSMGMVAVPEPSSVIAVLGGLTALAGFGRRRR